MYQKIVDHVNREISKFTDREYVPLGAAYAKMSRDEVLKNLTIHRMRKKFAPPVKESDDIRKEKSIAKMLDYDSNGIRIFDGNKIGDSSVRHHVYNARHSLRTVLSKYKYSFSNELRFPSGETYVSAGGDISLYAKLRDRNQWCCTPECFDMFALICYNTPMLKYAARRHINMWLKEENKRFDHKRMHRWANLKWSNPGKVAFEIFKAKLKCIITFVKGARLTTVPKDLETDRVIECDAFCNMVVQLTIDSSLWDLIEKEYGVDLTNSQVLHQLLIKDPSNATIDLKNASNSVFLEVVEFFIGGTQLFRQLIRARSGLVTTDPKNPDADWHPLVMLSPMGNGFTFGVMTLILLALSRELDSFAHVFGDDIVVDTTVAPHLIESLKAIGFETNQSKTFIEGPFRESCGGFTYNGETLTTFDFEWAEDVYDATILCNKVLVLANEPQHPLHFELLALHKRLVRDVPVHLQSGVVFVNSYSKRKLADDVFKLQSSRRGSNTLVAYHRGRPIVSHHGKIDFFNSLPSLGGSFYSCSKGLRKMQWKDDRSQSYFVSKESKDFRTANCLTKTPLYSVLTFSKKNRTYKSKQGRELRPLKNISHLFGWYYIWAGRSMSPNLRETYVSTEWRILQQLVF